MMVMMVVIMEPTSAVFCHVHDGAHARGRDHGDARDRGHGRDGDRGHGRGHTLRHAHDDVRIPDKRPLLQAVLSQDRFSFHRIQNLFSVDLIPWSRNN